MNDDGDATRIEHDREAQAYRLFVGDEERSHAQYREVRDDEGRTTWVFHHTFTFPEHRGHGYAETVVRAALDDVLTRDVKIVPRCWVVAEVVAADPRYADLVR